MKNRFFNFVMGAFLFLPLTGGIAEAKDAAPVSPSNQVASYSELSGIYYVLRHGESVPSSEKRVCSSFDAGVDPKNGLTEKGKGEVAESVKTWVKGNKKLLAKYLQQNKLVIVTSPFSRTKESADIFADTLQENLKGSLPTQYRAPGSLRNIIVVEYDLRERFFGKYEGQLKSGEIYEKVWAQDTVDPNQTKGDVESPNEVQMRASEVVAKLEKQSKQAGGKLFILVSHGDTLKILQTAFQKQSASEHCNKASVVPFKTAEIREFKLSNQPVQAQK